MKSLISLSLEDVVYISSIKLFLTLVEENKSWVDHLHSVRDLVYYSIARRWYSTPFDLFMQNKQFHCAILQVQVSLMAFSDDTFFVLFFHHLKMLASKWKKRPAFSSLIIKVLWLQGLHNFCMQQELSKSLRILFILTFVTTFYTHMNTATQAHV